MQRLFVSVLALAALATPAMAETRDVTGFDTVAASGRFRVEVAVGPDFTVLVEGPDASRIGTRVEGDTLKIEPLRRAWWGGNPRYNATVRVTAPRLEGVAAARGATVEATAGGECTDFSAASAMGGELRVTGIACSSVDAAAAMGATLRLEGACHNLDVAAAMGATVEAAELRCDRVDASAAMGGGVDAYASNTFDAAASMGGSIDISGGGEAGDQSAAMGGSITRRD
jgi:hypothetical protein